MSEKKQRYLLFDKTVKYAMILFFILAASERSSFHLRPSSGLYAKRAKKNSHFFSSCVLSSASYSLGIRRTKTFRYCRFFCLKLHIFLPLCTKCANFVGNSISLLPIESPYFLLLLYGLNKPRKKMYLCFPNV